MPISCKLEEYVNKICNQKTCRCKEVYLTYLANSHENIIQFRGITNFEDDEKHSLVLEYAEGGTLGKYLRDDTLTLKWENQIKFAKEITSAILWLHVDKGIVHGDLHPNNILINKETIKLADFGRSYQKESDCYNTEFGVLFWELTSRLSPFDGFEDDIIMFKILNGLREKPVPNTNVKFVGLYQECWKQEPDERPHISEVNEVLNTIDSENSGNNDVSTVPYRRGSEESTKKTEFVHSCQIDLNILCQKY
ncbi:kinase-like domain-containing protein [Rhizophagus irregularis DAOM 181602=DAOM 197198]|nr:kinase-like domain-containing protein [Rhizophagus irregularis DAOM 181602=DAOM 197198]